LFSLNEKLLSHISTSFLLLQELIKKIQRITEGECLRATNYFSLLTGSRTHFFIWILGNCELCSCPIVGGVPEHSMIWLNRHFETSAIEKYGPRTILKTQKHQLICYLFSLQYYTDSVRCPIGVLDYYLHSRNCWGWHNLRICKMSLLIICRAYLRLNLPSRRRGWYQIIFFKPLQKKVVGVLYLNVQLTRNI